MGVKSDPTVKSSALSGSLWHGEIFIKASFITSTELNVLTTTPHAHG